MELHNAYSRITLNINQEEWESNQPSDANFSANLERRTSCLGGQLWLGVTDHQEPTKRPLGQKITSAEWKNQNIDDLGKIIMECMFIPGKSMVMYVKYNIKTEVFL